jgi:hypothetical protein
LVLRDDGTYSQEVRIKANSDTARSQGKWRYRTHVRSVAVLGDIESAEVVFEDGFMQVLSYAGELNADYAHPIRAIVHLPVEYRLGRLILWEGEAGPQWEKID